MTWGEVTAGEGRHEERALEAEERLLKSVYAATARKIRAKFCRSVTFSVLSETYPPALSEERDTSKKKTKTNRND